MLAVLLILAAAKDCNGLEATKSILFFLLTVLVHARDLWYALPVPLKIRILTRVGYAAHRIALAAKATSDACYLEISRLSEPSDDSEA